MNIFACDCSTAHWSWAILENEKPILADSIISNHTTRHNLPQLFDLARQKAGWLWDDIDLFAVGRGPGNYSGLRLSITTISALSLPQKTPIDSLNSGFATAAKLLNPSQPSVAIVGDARRDQVWCAIFSLINNEIEQKGDWSLLAHNELIDHLPPAIPIATADSERLQPLIATDPGRWHQLTPSAQKIGELAFRRRQLGIASEPLSPVYLHPAVAPK